MNDGVEKPIVKLKLSQKLSERHTLRILIEILLLILLLAVLIRSLSPYPKPITEQAASKEIAELLTSSVAYKIVYVAKGDTLTKIFQAQGLENKTAIAILHADKDSKALKKLQFNQELRLLITVAKDTHKKTLTELQVPLNATQTLIFKKIGNNYQLTKNDIPLSTKIHYGKALLETSITAAIEKAALPKALTHKLINIFNYQVNFSRDLHPGDTFIIKYEARYKDNKLIDVLKIIAAEIQSKKTVYQAVSFQDSYGHESYYSPQGKGLQQSFLRWPIARGRISSGFSLERTHPVIGLTRVHKGTDFAAPYGTPIRATGDGLVTFTAVSGGYGRTIIINNGNGYNTLFAHLSRYAKDIFPGARVKQGQTIGYIGTSGLSTGPHVHYEFHINGQARDPMRVKLPSTKSLSSKEMKIFLPYAEQQLTDLVKHGGKGHFDKAPGNSASLAAKNEHNNISPVAKTSVHSDNDDFDKVTVNAASLAAKNKHNKIRPSAKIKKI